MTTISISKSKIEKQRGIVILPIREYQKLCQMAVPTYHLEGKEAEKLDKLVKKGLKDYSTGKTESMEKFLKREYPKFYEKHSKN